MPRLLRAIMQDGIPICPRCGAVVDGRIIRYGMAGENRVGFVRACRCGRRVCYTRAIRAIGKTRGKKKG